MAALCQASLGDTLVLSWSGQAGENFTRAGFVLVAFATSACTFPASRCLGVAASLEGLHDPIYVPGAGRVADVGSWAQAQHHRTWVSLSWGGSRGVKACGQRSAASQGKRLLGSEGRGSQVRPSLVGGAFLCASHCSGYEMGWSSLAAGSRLQEQWQELFFPLGSVEGSSGT